MNGAGSRLGAAWAWLGAALVVVLLTLTSFIKIPEPLPAARPENSPSVRVVDPVAIAGTMLLDPAPLFLPSRFSSSRMEGTPREPGGSFTGFAFKKVFSDVRLNLDLPPQVALPAGPAAMDEAPAGAPFLSFGRRDIIVQPVDRRGAYVEIAEAGTGRRVLGAALEDARPPSALPWKPMEYMAAVDAAGLIGPLTPVERSGVEDVDAYFERYLSEVFRIGQRLAPGVYRVTVGP